MEDTENCPPSKPTHQNSLAYSIQFEAAKQWKKASLPKCVKDYTSKPCPSSRQLAEKQEKASFRRKVVITNLWYHPGP